MKKVHFGKAVKKVSIVLTLVFALTLLFDKVCFAMISEETEVSDQGKFAGSICAENEKSGKTIEIPMTLTEEAVPLYSDDTEEAVTETYEAIVAIAADGSVSCVENVPPMTRTDASASDSNTYWKASVTITYSVNSSTASLTRVTGSWTQLRGNTTLSGRSVYYAINAGTTGYSDTKKPTTNSFAYNTGFPTVSSSRLYSIGANTSATVTTEAGLQVKLTTNVEKRYTN